MSEGDATAAPHLRPGMVFNSGDPICFLCKTRLTGFVVGVAEGGDQVPYVSALSVMSDSLLFHQIAANFCRWVAEDAGRPELEVRMKNASTVLCVFRKDDVAELWIDTAAIAHSIRSKRPLTGGQAVFSGDIADVLTVTFPAISIGPEDRVFCLLREGYRFALAFHLDKDIALDPLGFSRELGRLYRNMAFRELYDAVLDDVVFAKTVDAGWFPFVEIAQREYLALSQRVAAGQETEPVETWLIAAFDETRVRGMLERWNTNRAMASRADLLNEAVDAFLKGKPISVVRLLVMEIEGILRDAYRDVHAGAAPRKIDVLLNFAIESAEKKSGAPDTLMLPIEFLKFLKEQVFFDFDPTEGAAPALGRHVNAHGVAGDYTMATALRALLCVDQLFYYLP